MLFSDFQSSVPSGSVLLGPADSHCLTIAQRLGNKYCMNCRTLRMSKQKFFNLIEIRFLYLLTMIATTQCSNTYVSRLRDLILIKMKVFKFPRNLFICYVDIRCLLFLKVHVPHEENLEFIFDL